MTGSKAGPLAGNALAASSQLAVQLVVTFLLYAVLIRQLGAADVGIWLSVMAAALLACGADLGLTYALVRSTAVAEAEQRRGELLDLVDTGEHVVRHRALDEREAGDVQHRATEADDSQEDTADIAYSPDGRLVALSPSASLPPSRRARASSS